MPVPVHSQLRCVSQHGNQDDLQKCEACRYDSVLGADFSVKQPDRQCRVGAAVMHAAGEEVQPSQVYVTVSALS